MESTNTTSAIAIESQGEETVNNAPPTTANRAAPPPVPEAARLVRPRKLASTTVQDFDPDRDVIALPDEGVEPRLLTFPPSPRIPERVSRADWRLFTAIVVASGVSSAATVSAAYVAHARTTPSGSPATIELTSKREVARTPSHIATSVTHGDMLPSIGAPASRTHASTSTRTTHPAASAHVPATSVEPYRPELPFPVAVQMAEQRARGAIMMCGLGVPNATPTVRANVSYASDGSVSHVTLSSPWQGTEPGRCMARAITTRAQIPPFRAETYSAVFAFQAQ